MNNRQVKIRKTLAEGLASPTITKKRGQKKKLSSGHGYLGRENENKLEAISRLSREGRCLYKDRRLLARAYLCTERLAPVVPWGHGFPGQERLPTSDSCGRF